MKRKQLQARYRKAGGHPSTRRKLRSSFSVTFTEGIEKPARDFFSTWMGILTNPAAQGLQTDPTTLPRTTGFVDIPPLWNPPAFSTEEELRSHYDNEVLTTFEEGCADLKLPGNEIAVLDMYAIAEHAERLAKAKPVEEIPYSSLTETFTIPPLKVTK